MKKVLFALLCAGTFLATVVGGGLLAVHHLFAAKYKYLKVDFKGTVLQDEKYGSGPLNNYDLYLPADKGKEGYPLVLYIHGGGFSGGDKSAGDAKAYCEYFASKGIVAASVNYSLMEEGSSVGIGDMVDELVSASHAIVTKADKLGYPITEMATTGGSAGDCLAMLVAWKEPEKLPVPIRFVFGETGPATSDPELWGAKTNEEKAAFASFVTGRKFTAQDVGTPEFQAAIDGCSPAAQVKDGSVPVLVAYGPKDKVVPPQLKFALFSALDQHGIPYDYIEFPNSGHGMLNDPDKMEQFYHKMDEYLETYFHK